MEESYQLVWARIIWALIAAEWVEPFWFFTDSAEFYDEIYAGDAS